MSASICRTTPAATRTSSRRLVNLEVQSARRRLLPRAAGQQLRDADAARERAVRHQCQGSRRLAARSSRFSGSFPTGNATQSVEARAARHSATSKCTSTQGSTPAANAQGHGVRAAASRVARVHRLRRRRRRATAFRSAASTCRSRPSDNAFSGSRERDARQPVLAAPIVTITLGAYAGVTGLVDAETADRPSARASSPRSRPHRSKCCTDSTGRYTFQGIPTVDARRPHLHGTGRRDGRRAPVDTTSARATRRSCHARRR